MTLTPIDFLHIMQIMEIFDEVGYTNPQYKLSTYAKVNGSLFTLDYQLNDDEQKAQLYEYSSAGKQLIYEYDHTTNASIGNKEGVERFMSCCRDLNTTFNDYFNNNENNLVMKGN